MKKIMWIDDDISSMGRIVSGLFPKLWEKDCYNQIILTGDNYLSGSVVPINDGTIAKFAENISNRFEMFCSEKVNENYPTPKKVSEAKKDIRITKVFHIVKNEIEIIKEKIISQADDDTYIGLDILLFAKDKELNHNTETMKLFYSLSNIKKVDGKNKYSVFLYTIFNQPEDSKEKWVNKFREYHNDFQEKIMIFSTKKLISPLRDNNKQLNEFIEYIFKE
jgi:hypothetical protein